jgi:hypothetical protein
MVRFTLFALALTPLLAACGSSSQPKEDGGGLPVACAIVACDCVGASVGAFTLEDPRPVQWTANGQATCDPGWRLRRR